MSSQRQSGGKSPQIIFTDISTLPAPLYIKQSRTINPLVVNFYEFIGQCLRHLPQFPRLTGCKDADFLKGLEKLSVVFPAILPELTAFTEGLHRQHKGAYLEMTTAICNGAKLHADCVLNRLHKGRQLHRYDDCFIPLQKVMSFPLSRNGRAKLPPIHIYEGSRLESALVYCVSDITHMVFDHMRGDRQDDQVSYLIETTLHMATSDDIFIPSAGQAAKQAFKHVYRKMSEIEKAQVITNCHYTKCAHSRGLLDKWLLEIMQEDAAAERTLRDTAAQPVREFIAK